MVFVPFVSSPSVERRKLWRRKGGGGGGRGTGGGGGGGGRSGGGTGRTSSISTAGGTKSASTYSQGTTVVSSIPAGAPFAGRTAGGATRSDIYGSKAYGSGYPGVAGRGVGGLNFPFFFWPVTFVGVGGIYGASYYHNHEYGRANNGTRPGGREKVAIIATSGDNGETFRLMADADTVDSLVEILKTDCTTYLKDSNNIPIDDYDGADAEPPLPEQVIQYYRASSIALTSDSYNNSAAFSDDQGVVDSPYTPVNSEALNCLNTTIGEAAPLIDGAMSLSPPNVALLGFAGMVWMLVSQF